MKKKPEEKPKASLLVMGLLAAFFILVFLLNVLGERPRRVVSRSFAGAAVCTVWFLYALYEHWKKRK